MKNMARRRKKLHKALFVLTSAIMVTTMLIAALLPASVLAADVFDVVKQVAGQNSHITEGYDMFSSVKEPIPGGTMKWNQVWGDLDAEDQWAGAWFEITEPVGSTSMADVVSYLESELDEDAIMKAGTLNGYQTREITYADYLEGVPNDDAEVWIILDKYIISASIVETGYDKATNLNMGRDFALKLVSGLEQAGLLKPTATQDTGATTSNNAVVIGKALDEPAKVSDTMNIAGVYNGPTAPTTFTLSSPHLITLITNYHWNNSRGVAPGTIALQDQNGTVYGPWQATTRSGQGGVSNVYWDVSPNIVVPAGTYTIIDSDPSTWSQNSQSGGRGMGEVRATPHFEVTSGSIGDLTNNAGSGKQSTSGGYSESPAGVGSAGNIPGPANATEAVVGVVVPGLIATALGALGGLGGGGGSMPPGAGAPVYPTGGGSLPGQGGTPGTGSRTAGTAQATSQIGRRRNEEIYIDTVEMQEGNLVPRMPADNGILVETKDEAGIFAQPESGIYIDTTDMYENNPIQAGGSPGGKDVHGGVEPNAGIIIDTAAEGSLLRDPASGVIIDTAAEAGVFVQAGTDPLIETAQEESGLIGPDSGIIADDSGSGILIDTSALEDKPSAESGADDSAGGEAVSATEETADGKASIYDKDGYNADGFDKDGFDREGFNQSGYDRNGFDREGYDREGLDKSGYDRDGYDKEGYDKAGYDAEGYNREGFDQAGYDKEGFNKEGFDKAGFDKEGYDKAGYDAEGYNREGFDQGGYDKEGFNKEGFDKAGFDKEGYDKAGYDAEGYNREGFDQAGYDKEGFNKEGFDKAGFDKEGYDKAGYDAEGYNREGFDQGGYDKEGFNKEGFDKAGFDKEGFNRQGFDQKGFDREGYNKAGFDAEGYDREGFNKAGFDKEGYGRNGYDAEGFDREGFDVNGYNRQGYNRSGYNAEGYNKAGYDKEGFNKDGWDKDGYGRDGLNKEGFDRDGYDKAGYDKDGYDRDGYDREGRQREGYDEDGYDKNGFNENGYDRDGYDREGFDYEGYNRSGYDPWGYNKQGYNKDGYHWSGYNADGYDKTGRHWTENPYAGDSPFNVTVAPSPFAENQDVTAHVVVETDADGNVIGGYDLADTWKPTKPPLGEPYPKTAEKYGAKSWTDEIPQSSADHTTVPEDTGVIGPEDPMNTLKNHDIGTEDASQVPDESSIPQDIPQEDLPGNDSIPQEGLTEPEPADAIPADQPLAASDANTFDYTDPVTGETSTYEYEPGYTGPRHGDRQVLVGQGDGQTYELEFNAVEGKWINTESGNEMNIDDFDRWQNDIAIDKDRAAQDLEKMAQRQDANSQAIDQNLADWKKLEQMQKAADKYNIGNDGGPGDVDEAIEKLKQDMLNGKELDQEKLDKIRRVIDNRIQGKTTADTGYRYEEDWFKSNLTWALEANAATAKEVLTGEKADGSTSWLGLGARIMITAATGGLAAAGSLAPVVMDGGLTIAEAMLRIKDEIDKGETGFRAAAKAIGMVVLGEEASWLMGKAGGKIMGEMLERFPAFTNKAADLIETAILKGRAWNQMLSKSVGMVSKESAEEALDQINKRLIDIGSDEAAAGIAKTANKSFKLSAANQFDDIFKGGGKSFSSSADDILKGGGKSASSGWTDIGEGGGRAASGSVDDISKGAGKSVSGNVDDISKGAGKAASGSSDDIAKGAGKAGSASSDDAAKAAEKATAGKTISTDTPGLEIDNSSFKEAGLDPDLRGMPNRDQKSIRMICDKHGVKAHMRPTNPESKVWLETGKAHPKPEMLKTKTINEYDVELGYPKEYTGTVACRKPDPLPSSKPDGMSDEFWDGLQKRHSQRTTEYTDQIEKLKHLEAEGKIFWDQKTGIIYNSKTMKPYAGDHDAFAFVDAVSGKPVSPQVNQQLNRELQSLGATQHPEHVGWDYSNLSDKVPEGSPVGAQSPKEIAEGIDNKILSGHDEGGQPLNTYDPLRGEQGGWTTNWWKGGVRQ